MRTNIHCALALLVLGSACASTAAADGVSPFVGRWALTIPGGGAGWLGVAEKDGQLTASILWGGGSVVPLSSAAVDGDTLVVTRVHRMRRRDPASGEIRRSVVTETIAAKVSGDTLQLTQVLPRRGGRGEVRNEFTGKRIPPLAAHPDLSHV